MRKNGWLIPLGILIAGYLIWAGCSGGGSPLAPDVTEKTGDSPELSSSLSGQPDEEFDRIILGAYRVVIDENGVCTVSQSRHADAHINVTGLIFPPNCYDCFTGEFISLDGEDWTFNFTLKNPSTITGYDVRAILLDMADLSLSMPPDSYTMDFADESDPTPRNPFLIFDSGHWQNEWGPMTIGSREVTLTRPEGSTFGEIEVVIDARWPENQDEPTIITNVGLSSDTITNDGSDFTNLTCRVEDWQDDVDSVSVDLTPIGGGADAGLLDNGNGNWALAGIECGPGITAGNKTLWITASSGGGQIYNSIDVTVAAGPESGPSADWTMLLYLHAADLPDAEDINELEMSGSVDGELNILVLWDKTGAPDVVLKVENDPGGYNTTIVSNPVPDDGGIIPPGGLDMGDGATLEAFLIWAMAEYPANHYVLDLWDHGAGIFVGEDQPLIYRNVCGGLSLWEIRDACQAALDSQFLVDKIDIIGFDVCILGWIETAYCLRDVADIVIASENNEPGGGWDYGPPFINLRDNIGTYTAEQLAYDIVEYYMISYTDPAHPYHYLASECTQAAGDTSVLVDTTVPTLNTFSQKLMSALPAFQTEIAQCRASTAYWGAGVSDIGHFAEIVADHPTLPAALKTAASDMVIAVEAAMIHNGHNAGVPDGESGWKIWFPADISTESTSYRNQYQAPGFLEFGDTQWNDFLWKYCGQDPVLPGWLQVLDSEFDDSVGGNGNGLAEPGEEIDVTLTLKNNGGSTATNVQVILEVETGSETEFEILAATQSFPNIGSGLTGVNSVPFRIHILPTATSGTTAVALADITSDQSDSMNIPITFPIDPADYLVIDLDVDFTSGSEIASVLDAIGYTPDHIINTRIGDASMDSYYGVFITLGMYDSDDYSPDQADYDAVEAYLNGGGRIFMEGGDVWYWMPSVGSPDFSPLFGISTSEDGETADLNNLVGEPGTFLEGLTLAYTGDSDYPDYLNGTGGSEVVLSNDSPVLGAMVAFDTGTYRTIGASFEFGGISDEAYPNTQIELMNRIVSFLFAP